MERQLSDRLVLILEEEPLTAIEIADALHEANAEPILANSVEEALALVEALKFSAAVLGCTLKHGDCAALYQRLSERGVPFVFFASGLDMQESNRLGPTLLKPVHIDRLIDTLAEFIDQAGSKHQATA